MDLEKNNIKIKLRNLLKSVGRCLKFSIIIIIFNVSFYNLIFPTDATNDGITISTESIVVNRTSLIELIRVLPFVLLVEDIIFRGLLVRIYRRYKKDVGYTKFMLYMFFISGSAFHLIMNVTSSTPIGAFKYYLIHGLNGVFFGYICIKYNFWEGYISHLLYDAVLLGVLLI